MGAPRIFPANAGEGFFSSGIVDNFNFHLLHTHSAVYFKISCESEPIFGYQCNVFRTERLAIVLLIGYLSIAQHQSISMFQYCSISVSGYRHHPLFVTTGPSGSTFANPLPTHPTLLLASSPFFTFPFLLFCCLSLTPTVLYGN